MDGVFIIGEKCQCGVCFAFFRPDPAIPHPYCSKECNQIAEDEKRLARIEFERMLQETA